jgi:hypothetical protein
MFTKNITFEVAYTPRHLNSRALLASANILEDRRPQSAAQAERSNASGAAA